MNQNIETKIEDKSPIQVFDSINEEDLINSMTVPVLKTHNIQTIVPISLSPAHFWDKYLATDSEFWMGKFYHLKGEKKI